MLRNEEAERRALRRVVDEADGFLAGLDERPVCARWDVDAVAETLDAVGGGPIIVCLQAGNVHSGAYDPLGDAIDLAHRYGAWVHVDGAFGLWAPTSSRLRSLTAGMERAESWVTDAHKTLNVPYDCGLAIVPDTEAMYAAMGLHAAYLIQDERPDPFSTVPEFSRRARGFTVWAALRSLGRVGVAEMVEGFCARATQFADGLRAVDGVRVLNDVVFTQVCATFGSDDVTRRGEAVLRISVSNWRTSEIDVDRTLGAIRRVLAGARRHRPV